MTIILSRHRDPNPTDARLADALASRCGVTVLDIPFLYDLRAFGPTVARLREIEAPLLVLAPLPVRATRCLLGVLGVAAPSRGVVDTSEADVEEIIKTLRRESGEGRIERLEEPIVPRWYPVVDRAECTGCLECVNFCLFGVYVIGQDDMPKVDQPDACRDGCPACSRVCPGAAIMFPMHDDPDISGYELAEDVRKRRDAETAEAERRRHTTDTLDDWVEQVDRFEV